MAKTPKFRLGGYRRSIFVRSPGMYVCFVYNHAGHKGKLKKGTLKRYTKKGTLKQYAKNGIRKTYTKRYTKKLY